jgi:hypothetical protein
VRLAPSRALVLLAALCWLPLTAGAARGEPEWFHETLELDAAATFAFFDTQFSTSGVEFDLEDDVGFDAFAVMPSVDAHWRFTENKKHRLEFSYFAILRDGGDRTGLELGSENGQPLSVSLSVDGDIALHVFSLTYAYSILHDEQKEFGILGGLDYIDFAGDAQGRLQIPQLGVDVTQDLFSEEYSTPFPTAGAYLGWRLLDDLALSARFQYFGIKVGGVGGEIYRGGVRLRHRTFRNVHLYVGYELLGADVDIGSDSFDDVQIFYHGPRAGLAVVF